jgi:hypothetical protein
MRAVTFLILITMLSPWAMARVEAPQGGVNARGVVESAEISGIDENEINPEIRDAVRRLVGQPFDQQAADALVMRIQTDKPEYKATTRLLAGDQSDRVKVVFFVERAGGELGDVSNVNERYMVERVEVEGYDETKLSRSIRDDLKSLVGVNLDPDKADEIRRRIDDDLRPRYFVLRRVVKGSDRQHIIVIFEVRKVRMIPFISFPRQRLVYHSKQNFSADLNVPIPLGGGSRFLFGLADDQDALLERYAGFSLGLEMTKVGTEHLGLALHYSRYHDRWQPATVLASSTSVYRERNTFEPMVTIAFDSRLRLSGGVSVSELEMQHPSIHRANANAAFGRLTFQNNWQTPDARHLLRADYDLRAGNREMDSDFVYTRHLVHAQYGFGSGHNRLLLSFQAGTITGNAPLFERFSLGDTTTLRGWNKFDVAPVGGNRMIHSTLQYGIGGPRFGIWTDNGSRTSVGFGFHVFYDVGAVGDRGAPIQTRHSAGFGFGSPSSSGFFIELGFPIRSERVQPIFSTGFRF